MQPNFSTAIATGEKETRVYLRGELDVQSSPALDGVLADALAAGLPIVIDCAGLSYCDSFGIRSVLTAGLRAQRDRIALRIVNPDARVRRILEMSGVAEIIPLD